jgi:hypothetical protein
MSIVLIIQHAEHMCHVVRLYDIFPHNVINSTICGKRLVIEDKICVLDFLYQFFLKCFSF